MSKKADPRIIGAFVVGAVVLAVAGTIIFAGGEFFREEVEFVAHFQGSVGGLDPGAQVRFRGVPVGRVERIVAEYHPDAESEDDMRIVVHLVIVRGSVEVHGQRPGGDDVEEGVQHLIEEGMRAQLVLDSLITGKLFVALDLHPDTEVRLLNPPGSKPTELPTIPTGFQQLQQKIEELHLEELFGNANRAVANLADRLESPEVERMVTSADSALNELDQILKKTNQEIDGVVERLNGALAKAEETLEVYRGLGDEEVRLALTELEEEIEPLAQAVRDTLARVESTAAELQSAFTRNSELRLSIARTLEELGDAIRSIRVLANYLERHPEALLRGKGGS